MSKKAYIVVMTVLLILFAAFFGLLIALAVLQDNNPAVFDRIWLPLVIALATDAAAMIALIIIFFNKLFVAEWLMKRQKLEKTALPHVLSARPATPYGELSRAVTAELAADGFTIAEHAGLSFDPEATMAYRVKFNVLKDFIADYLFLLNFNSYTTDDLDELLQQAYARVEDTQKHRIAEQLNRVAICVFSDEIPQQMAQNGNNLYDKDAMFLFALYELSTGRVVFMNGKSSKVSNFAGLQRLVWRYIVGNKVAD